MTDRLLVTGGAGFIGSHVTELLVEEGYEVTVLDSFTTGYRQNLNDPDINLIEGDIREQSILDKVLPAVDGIFHLAAHVGNVKSIECPIKDTRVNVEGTLRLLEGARKCDVSQFVYSSSAAIFGEVQYTPVDESHPVNPASPYGATKLAGEKHATIYSELYELEVTALRYFNVYGVNQRYDEYGNVIPIWAHRLLNDDPLIVYGDGKQTRDFINARDVARANLLAYETEATGQYNIGTGEATEIGTLASKLMEASDRDATVTHEPPREGEVRHSVADVTKAKQKLGFEPTVSLEVGLEEYVDWLASDGAA